MKVKDKWPEDGDCASAEALVLPEGTLTLGEDKIAHLIVPEWKQKLHKQMT